MDPINLFTRIREEVNEEDAREVLVLCFQFFSSSSEQDFLEVLDKATQLLRNPALIDPIELLLETIAFQAQQNVLLLKTAKEWTGGRESSLKAIDIESDRWKVSLRDDERNVTKVIVGRDQGDTPLIWETNSQKPIPFWPQWDNYSKRLDGF